MQLGNTDSQTGKLKVLAGPDALIGLIRRATNECSVTVGNGVLRWASDPRSPGGTVRGDQIQSVAQHETEFAVHLKSSGNGIHALTFGASSSADAENWVRAVERIIETASAAQPRTGSTQRPLAAGTGPTLSLDPTPVRLKYMVDGDTIEKDYALLVIACDPRALIGICDYTGEEIEILKQLFNYTFHTTLMKVKVPAPQDHAVVFAPLPLEAMNGSVYAYRNESAKQFGLATANKMTENLVTVYQLATSPLSEKEFEELLLAQLQTCSWWPFGQDAEIRASVTTPYFDRFGDSSLKVGLPWSLLQRQGQKQTLLVHASTCFESALHCWTYANLMLESVPGAKQALPKNSAAPIVVLGAGVSGILFAARLKSLGYTNIDVLENTERYGGKTHTIIEDGPYPEGSHAQTVCELGTCYLSPAYGPMVEFLQGLGVLAGNDQIDFESSKSFRGIVTAGEFSSGFKVAPIINYSDYVVLKAEYVLGLSDSWLNQLWAKTEIAYALAKYTLLHVEYMGWDMPMPPNPPPDLLFTQSFTDFLSANGLLSLIGFLQYGYEVQGYGALRDISAYYGLVWITPAITWTILMDSLGVENKPVVTAWTKGWGDVWKQIVTNLDLNITYSARTTSITRS